MQKRTITVYGAGAEPLGEHYGVSRLRLPPNGHLIIDDLWRADSPAQTVCYAAGHWLTFYDFTMPAEQPAEQPAPVVVPGPEVPPDPFLSLPRAPFNAEVHAAMQITCMCAEIRCPIVLNPPTGKERSWWRVRPRSSSSPGQVEPVAMEQCIHDRGHDTDDLPHEWILGGWPYGPANHHPSCPRHPKAYNRPTVTEGEGQPQHATGLTPEADVWQQHGPDWCPDGAHPPADTAVIVTEPAQISARATVLPPVETELVRPYLASRRPEYNQAARTSWGVCGAWGPPQGDEEIWCTLLPHSPDHVHQHRRPGGGDRISW